jgi:putative membrane protein
LPRAGKKQRASEAGEESVGGLSNVSLSLPAMPDPTTPPRSSDSRARDHLANERTFLAWVRTGVALVGFGILIAKLRDAAVGLPGPAPQAAPVAAGRSALLGAAFALLGILVIVLGAGRYAAGERAIESNEYQPRGAQLLVLAFLLVLLGVAVLFYLSDLWRL